MFGVCLMISKGERVGAETSSCMLVLRFTVTWAGSSDSGVIREPRLVVDPWLPAVLQEPGGSHSHGSQEAKKGGN